MAVASCTLRNTVPHYGFRLIPISLDDDPAYLALSYNWGEATTVGQFRHSENGQTVRFTRSVSDILQSLVLPGTTLFLWIDALCINQEDRTREPGRSP